ncbi:hypothetical protein [Candidatus Tisiphia endosymbiont of Dascillus cervinus]|uniref:hypothetical protein n=1 Tax=Candidatus Tisiphia endosymbiont of Dascillus cervinus TaxID=3066253 RepID=UPI00312C843C
MALTDYTSLDATKRGVHSSASRATDITESFCYMSMDVKTGDEQQQSQYDIVQHRKVMNDYNALER